jgi:hypothetical protein
MEILMLSRGDAHYENYATIGRVDHLGRYYRLASTHYSRALYCLNEDPKLDKSARWYLDTKKQIETWLNEVETNLQKEKEASARSCGSLGVVGPILDFPLTTVTTDPPI